MATTTTALGGDLFVSVVPDSADETYNKEDDEELVARPSEEVFVTTPCNKNWQDRNNGLSKAVVTPETNAVIHGSGSSESGDTCSETSVASESNNKEALDILFGKHEDDAKKEILNNEQQDDDDDENEQTGVRPATVQKEDVAESEPTEQTRILLQCITSSDCTVATSSAADAAVVIVMEPLPSPPRRTSRVNMTAAALVDRLSTPRNTNKPSPAPVVGTGGLSELSKQLRILQAKNQYLQSEMERCQRQLNIMSESKGVSVVDIMSSLEAACASVAHAELQSQITSLQAQLEAMKHGKTTPPRGGIAKATQLQHDSLKQQIATLQLQLGEHEELEIKYKEETKSLYGQVQHHQTRTLTLESMCDQQRVLLETERAKTTALESEVTALRQERDILKEKQTKRMAEFWQQTLHSSWSMDENENENDNDYQLRNNATGLYRTTNDISKESVARQIVDGTSDKPTEYFGATSRPKLSRAYSDPAMWSQDPDSKTNVPKSYVSSLLPRYSKSYKQWTYDADDTHRSKLYVKQSAKNMELEVLCRHQQQTLQELQQEQTRDQANWERLEQERNAAQARRNIVEQQVHTMQLDLRLEQEQAETLRAQLQRREDEYSLKKDQLTTRLQVHQERTVDLEGQLSSLYFAYELLQEDRSEEQTQQAALMSRLIDADSTIAQQISEKAHATNDATLARVISQQDTDVSESSVASAPSTSEMAQLGRRAGMLMPSPLRNSRRGLFSTPSLKGLPKMPPFASGSRRSSTSSVGLPPTAPTQSKQRRLSTGSLIGEALPPPGTTICKGYLLQQQPRKKKLLGGGKPPAWKKKYVVLKRGDGPAWVGSYCLWLGDIPQGQVLGTIPHLIRGVSTISFSGSVTTDPNIKPHSFVLRINPSDPDAPVVHFAASSSTELEPWQRVLQEALNVDFNLLNLVAQQQAQVLTTVAVAKNYGL
jgi:PH domain